MNSHNKSRQEMLDIQYATRLVLCKILALMGFFFLLTFSGISYTNHYYLLASILFACALSGTVIIYLLYRTANIQFAVYLLNINLFVLPLTLLVTGGHENTGMLWIYPMLAINLFVNRFWTAVILYGGFIVISSLLLFTPLSNVLLTSYSLSESIRFEVTLFVLCLICLTVLHSKERADEMIIHLHDEDMRKLAYYDALTGLPNRTNFRTNLSSLLRRANREGKCVGLLYIDLDNFKQVNDNYGHEIGDLLLCRFSEKLKQIVRPTDVVLNDKFDELARLGGDEFVVILHDLDSPVSAATVAERILGIFENGFETMGNTHSVFASIGIAVFPEDAETPDELLHNADLAMYEAKRNGRNRFEFYTKNIAEILWERRRIEDGLKAALELNLFSLAYMPLFDCRTLEIVGIEVLLRCPNLAVDGIGPGQFIPIAEKTSLIKNIDLWVIENSIATFADLRLAHGFTGKLCINISGVELQNESFPAKVGELLDVYQVAASSIEFEITETAFVVDNTQGITMLEQVKALGITLALDDFGTGYTAFGQLNNYPVDCLKIDSSFVGDLFSDHVARQKMVGVITSLGKLYSLRVVAEGVETQKQLEHLQEIGCDWVQGRFLSCPLEYTDLIVLLSQNKAESDLVMSNAALS